MIKTCIVGTYDFLDEIIGCKGSDDKVMYICVNNEAVEGTQLFERFTCINDLNIDTYCDSFTDKNFNNSYALSLFLIAEQFDYCIFQEGIDIGFCALQFKTTTNLLNNTKIYVCKYNYYSVLVNSHLSKIKQANLNVKRHYYCDFISKYSDRHITIDEIKNGNIYYSTTNKNSLKDNLDEFEKVSVCITNYNYGKYLPMTIQSVFDNKYPNLEIILVDDGSDDKYTQKALDELINKFSTIHLYRTCHLGAGAAKNYAAKQATGKYLLFVDGDDYLEPTAIKSYLLAIKKTSANWINSYFSVFYSEDKPAKHNISHVVPIPGNIKDICMLENVFGACNFLIERDVFFAVNGFPEEANIYDDWGLFIKLCMEGYKQMIVPLVLFDYRKKEKSLSTRLNKEKATFNTLKIFLKYIPESLHGFFLNYVEAINNVF